MSAPDAAAAFAYQSQTLRVGGMDCASCAQTIERAVTNIDGVASCRVNFPAAELHVEFDRAKGDVVGQTRRRVASLGFSLTDVAQPQHAAVDARMQGWRAWARCEWSTLVAALLTIIAAGLSVVSPAPVPALAHDALYAVAIIVGGYSIARAGLVALITTRRPDMKLLMTIAVIGAVAIGAWLEAALVVVLFSIGEALEAFAVQRARASVGSLIELMPQTARLVRSCDADDAAEQDEIEVPISTLATGDLIVVLPGERIAADADVVEGHAAVNQAAITGESVPMDVASGDSVFAGTLNGEGRLLLRVTAAPGDTTLDRIARAVADAQASKAPSERWVDAFAAWYTPLVMLASLLVIGVPPLLLGADAGTWFYRGLALLLLACPCALVISTPVAIVSALGRAARSGVLIKGGEHLETAASIRAVCFDKTGTVTDGRPVVTRVVAANASSEREVLELAAAVEQGSEHPLAAVIVAHARAQLGAKMRLPASEVVTARGLGVTARVGRRSVRVGNVRHLADHPDVAAATRLHDELAATGQTVVVVATETEVLGAIGLRDEPRHGVREAIADLRRAGVEHVAMLTGDHAIVAEHVASAIGGVDEVHAALLPVDKVTRIEQLQRRFGPTAMVGDGVNDAPALATSALGVAMGTAGSATAIETADVSLAGDNLHQVAGVIGLARWSRLVVRQNISFALGTKLIAAVFALVGMFTLWMAVLVDVGATLLVVANGLRLMRSRPAIGRYRTLPLLARAASSTQHACCEPVTGQTPAVHTH